MNIEDLVAYVDGELSPEARLELERALAGDPAAMDALRKLCRQRLMMAEVLARSPLPHRSAGRQFRVQWSVAAALLFFGLTVTAVWIHSRDSSLPPFQILHGKALVDGETTTAVSADSVCDIPEDAAAEVGLGNEATALLLPKSRAALRRRGGSTLGFVELRKGTARLRDPRGAGEVRVAGPQGTFVARGAEFTTEIVFEPERAGDPAAAPVAVAVSAALGDVQVEAWRKRHVVRPGQVVVFGMNGDVVVGSVAEFLEALEERKEKGQKDKK